MYAWIYMYVHCVHAWIHVYSHTYQVWVISKINVETHMYATYMYINVHAYIPGFTLPPSKIKPRCGSWLWPRSRKNSALPLFLRSYLWSLPGKSLLKPLCHRCSNWHTLNLRHFPRLHLCMLAHWWEDLPLGVGIVSHGCHKNRCLWPALKHHQRCDPTCHSGHAW